MSDEILVGVPCSMSKLVRFYARLESRHVFEQLEKKSAKAARSSPMPNVSRMIRANSRTWLSDRLWAIDIEVVSMPGRSINQLDPGNETSAISFAHHIRGPVVRTLPHVCPKTRARHARRSPSRPVG
jgi:hypothetical protein